MTKIASVHFAQGGHVVCYDDKGQQIAIEKTLPELFFSHLITLGYDCTALAYSGLIEGGKYWKERE